MHQTPPFRSTHPSVTCQHDNQNTAEASGETAGTCIKSICLRQHLRVVDTDAPEAMARALQPRSSRGGKGSTTFSRTSTVFISDAFWTVLDSLSLELQTPAAVSGARCDGDLYGHMFSRKSQTSDDGLADTDLRLPASRELAVQNHHGD